MTKKQLITLLAACAWVSLVTLDREGLFATIALNLPALLLAGILYCWFGGLIPKRSYLFVGLAVALGLSIAFLKGYHDCCKPSNYLVLPIITSDGRVIPGDDLVQKLKTASEVRSEVIAYSIPVILFGSVVFWWLKTNVPKHRRNTSDSAIIDAEHVELIERTPRQLGSGESRRGT